MQTETKQNKFDIQIIWFYKDIDGLVLVTCRLQVNLRPTVKEFTCVNQNNFARNFCKYYSLNPVVGEKDLLPAQCLYEMEGSMININMYNEVAILKIKMAAKIGKIQLGIHPEKSSFCPI